MAHCSWRYHGLESPQRFEANVTVPMGMKQAAELHLHLDDLTENSNAVDLIDLTTGHVVPLHAGVKLGRGALPAGVEFVSVLGAPNRVEIHLASGEFMLSVQRGSEEVVA